MADSLLYKVKNTIEKYQMLALNDVVLVGVSGGPDSIALLHILNLLKEEYKLNLFVVHLNHMFRGEEAQREAQYVADLAKEWGLDYRILERDIPKLSKEKGLSPEEAGHKVRKEIFHQIGQEVGANKLALGHHVDDRAETVLLHLIQGTGLEGLAGMPPVNGWLIRPLAQCYKGEIIDYCQVNDLRFCLDPSNKKPVYLRNKIRLKLLPYLKENFNPQMVESLVRLEDIVVEENRYLDNEVSRVFKNVLITQKEGNITLSINKLKQEHLAIQRRVIRKVYNLLRSAEQGLSFIHVEKTLDLSQANKGAKQLNLPQGIIVKVTYDRLEFVDSEMLKIMQEIKPFNFCWNIPGTIQLPNNIILNASYSSFKPEIAQGFLEVSLDGDKITTPLTVRRRKPGDRIQPLGMVGSKKLKDIFIDRKITKEERDNVPVVCLGKEIIWLPGITINEAYKVSPGTKQYLKLKLSKK